MNLSEWNKWDIYIVANLVIWWFFPIISKILVTEIHYIFALWLSAFFASLYFLFMGIIKKEWKYFIKSPDWKYLIMHSIINGIIFYGLIFYGLQYTSAINGSVFWLTEIFFSYLFFWFIFTKQKSKLHEIIWTLLIVIWTLFIIFPWKINVNIWDLMIILAMAIVPFWNQCTKLAARTFSSNFIMLIRSWVTALFLISVGVYFFVTPDYATIQGLLFELIVSWVLIFWLSKQFLVEWMKRISIPRASSFIPLYPLLTIFYAIWFYGIYPDVSNLTWLIPMIIGTIFLFNQKIFNKVFWLKPWFFTNINDIITEKLRRLK